MRHDVCRLPRIPRFTPWCGTTRTEAWHLRFGAESLAMRAGADGPVPSDRAEALDGLIERYRRAWLTTSRPGGLDRSEAHLERTRDALRSRPGTA